MKAIDLSGYHDPIDKVVSYEKREKGILFHCLTKNGRRTKIELVMCSPHVLRFRMYPIGVELKESLLEINEELGELEFDFKTREFAERITIESNLLKVSIDKKPWKYTIYSNISKEVLLEEAVRDLDSHGNYRSPPLGFIIKNGNPYGSTETFSLYPSESFYGFGEKFTRLNKLGQTIRCWNCNPFGVGTEESYKNIPFFISSRGYGVFVNTSHPITFEMGSRSLMTYTLWVKEPRLDLFIIYGPSLKDVLRRYVEITGYPSLPPLESFGIWYTPYFDNDPLWVVAPDKKLSVFYPLPSNEKVEESLLEKYFESVISQAEMFRKLDVPVDIFMCTGFGLTPSQTKELCERLSRYNIKVGMYVAPLLNLGTEMEKEARRKGYVLRRRDGSPYEIPLGFNVLKGEKGEPEYSLEAFERTENWRWRHNKLFYIPCLMPDFTNPETVRWWKEKIGEYIEAGVFGVTMSDFGEDVPADAYYYNGRSGEEMHNIYPLLYQKTTFEAVAEKRKGQGLVNARSGYAGMQKYPICWCGDPNCTWQDMIASIRGGLSIGLSGVPFWSCDVGGYQSKFGELTTKLWIRWFQWAMFTSHVRLHGEPPPRAPWIFGEEALQIFRKYVKLRYRLLPYIYSQAYISGRTGLPMMRAMILEFQDDPNCRDLDDQYMFGDSLLVAPVCDPSDRRTVYLPKGKWIDYWTGEEYEGPTVLHLKVPLEIIPLYIKMDSIIPMGPEMSYVGEKPFDPLTLDIWVDFEAKSIIYLEEEIIECNVRKTAETIVISLKTSKPSKRTFMLKINKAFKPREVRLNDLILAKVENFDYLENGVGWWFDENNSVLYIRLKEPLRERREVALQAKR
jgi:alpha-D-xyloside xylohydrolase